MEVDVMKVIEKLTMQVADQAYQIAILQTQVEAMAEEAEDGNRREATEIES